MSAHDQARATMERDVKQRLTDWNVSLLNDRALFDIWCLVVKERELWYHAAPHHHREISVLLHNASVELFG